MKVKKLFLKLFLMAFFISMLLPKDALAAVSGQTDLNISSGSIFIGDDKVGYYNGASNTATADSVTTEVVKNSKGYTISGTAAVPRTIIIDVSGTLNLSFQKLDMNGDCQLIIRNGTVNVTLYDKNTIRSDSDHAIVLENSSQLTIKGTGELSVTGATNKNAVNGTTNTSGTITTTLSIEGGTVTLNKSGNNSSPTSNTNILISGGSLKCHDNGYPTDYGNGALIQKGGTVDASGLAKIDYENELITDIPNGTKVQIDGGSDFSDLISNGTLSIKDYPQDWHKKTLVIGRQSLYIPERPSKSSGAVKLSDETYALAEDGAIGKINTATMEYVVVPTQMSSMSELAQYMDDHSMSWESFGADEVYGCAPGFYYIRLKGNNDTSQFPTDPIKYGIEIKKGIVLKFTAPENFKATFGYVSAIGNIMIQNYGDESVEITQVRSTGTDSSKFTISDDGNHMLDGRTSANDSARTYNEINIVPQTGLSAGTYTVTVNVSYKIGEGSAATEPVEVTFVVEKAEQADPTDTLTVTNITYNSATLSSIQPNSQNPDPNNGVEYSFSTDGEWSDKNKSDTPQFTGKLSPETHYYFFARYKESTNYAASNPVITEGTTEKAASIDYENQKLNFAYDNRKYTVTVGSGGEPQTYENVSSIDIPDDWCGKSITITDATNKGTQTIALPAIRKAPSPKAVDEKIIGDNGEITNVSTLMEYRIKLSKTVWSPWFGCLGTKITDATPGDYQIRTKATDTQFPSAIASVTVHKGPSISVELQGADFDEIPYGTITSGKIIIQNRDVVPVKLEGITLSAENFVITEGEKELEPSDYVEWEIQPKEKLNVGTYESELIVSYDDTQDEDDDDYLGDDDVDNSDDGSGSDSDGNGSGSTEPGSSGSGNTDSGSSGSGNTDSGSSGSGSTDSGSSGSGNTDSGSGSGSGNTDSGSSGSDSSDSGSSGSDDTDSDADSGSGSDISNNDQNEDESGDEQIEAFAVGDAAEVTVEEEESNIRTESIEVKATIVKAPQTDVPPVPAEKSKTATSITLETIPNNPVTGAKVQYSKDGGRTWQDSPTFTGLSPNREYTFVARYAETDNYEASDISNGEVTITTAEKDDSDSDSAGINSQATNDGTNSNGTGNGTGTNGTGTNGTGTNGTGTNGTGSGTDDSSSSSLLSSAKTGDLNNIHLWVALIIGSYLSCAIIVKSRFKKM